MMEAETVEEMVVETVKRCKLLFIWRRSASFA